MSFYNHVKILFVCLLFFFTLSKASTLNIVRVDERAICNIKTSCLDCLRLPHCSWCPTEKKCFSEQLPHIDKYCEKEKVRNQQYEMSLEDNAICACTGDKLENNCRPLGSSGPDCSGRGTCVCGRCFCDSKPDPAHPSKVIIGEHCEYDNFSCDDPKCNEGPYSIYEMMTNEKNADLEEEMM